MKPDFLVVWRVTEKCNLACPFCAYDRSLSRARAVADPAAVLRMGRMLRDSGRKTLVSWLGGEPFLWPPLLDVSRTFKREFGLQVAVTTNGLALRDERIREQLVDDFDQVTISIDDVGAAHDRLRGAPGLFDRLRRSLPALAELAAQRNSPLLVRVNTVLMHANLQAFEPLCRQLAEWGVAEVTFNTLGGRDRPEFFPSNRLTGPDAAWLRTELPGLRERLQARGLALRGSPAYLERILQLAQDETYPVADCNPGQQFLFIDERGLAAPCHFTVDGYGLPLENLRSAADLEALPALFWAQKQRQQLAPCLDCRSTQVFGKFENVSVPETSWR